MHNLKHSSTLFICKIKCSIRRVNFVIHYSLLILQTSVKYGILTILIIKSTFELDTKIPGCSRN